ncbi:alpha/beta hydrolase (plasmid) [Rhodococcoides fascians A21d2]|uniref:alpha/beta fold hydrolase n=1 Tax=Rhodococcoides fascians TaxID=1828 RepID=UPI00055E1601|nr:alpha/beta hydrolase [Rhodococcus fascians]QII03690.1 alpha/beta hydrolase [Rhodococcus fascians A21d2]
MKYFAHKDEAWFLDNTTRARLRGEFVELSNGVTHYELGGPDNGEIVVLPGGITVPLFYWDDTVAVLHEHGFRTLTYSAYGRGYSDRIAARYDAGLFVDQLVDLVDTIGITEPHHVVGASMGALVGMRYTQRCLRSVRSLSLIGPAGIGPRPLMHRVMMASDLGTGLVARRFGRGIFDKHQRRNVTDPALAAKLQAMVSEAYRYQGSLYAFFRTLTDFPLFDQEQLYREIGDLDVPTLLIWGTGDLVTPISSLDRVRDLLHPTELMVVENCGHMVPFERPRLVADSITSFITSSRNR